MVSDGRLWKRSLVDGRLRWEVGRELQWMGSDGRLWKISLGEVQMGGCGKEVWWICSDGRLWKKSLVDGFKWEVVEGKFSGWVQRGNLCERILVNGFRWEGSFLTN